MQFLSNMKIRQKIIGLVAGVMILMMVAVGFGIFNFIVGGGEILEIARDVLPLTSHVSSASSKQLQESVATIRIFQSLLSNDQEGLNAAINRLDEVSEQVVEELDAAIAVSAKSLEEARSPVVLSEMEIFHEHLIMIKEYHQELQVKIHQALEMVQSGERGNLNALAEEIKADQDFLESDLEDS